MPIPRNPDRAQISLDTGVYGSLPWEGMPAGDANAQIFYWHQNTYGGGQWVPAVIVAGVGMDIDYDQETGALTFTNTDYRVYDTAVLDAVLLVPVSSTFAADAVLA